MALSLFSYWRRNEYVDKTQSLVLGTTDLKVAETFLKIKVNISLSLKLIIYKCNVQFVYSGSCETEERITILGQTTKRSHG